MSYGLGGVIAFMQPSNIAIWDEDRTTLYNPIMNWNYRKRGYYNDTNRGLTPYTTLWPPAQLSNGDPTTNLALMGQDSGSYTNPFEPWSLGDSGQMGVYFIRGQCLDQYGNILAGSIVQAFITSTDVLVGTTTADNNGNYACPTPYAGVQHYIVAYYAATNLAGTTIDTLVPTN